MSPLKLDDERVQVNSPKGKSSYNLQPLPPMGSMSRTPCWRKSFGNGIPFAYRTRTPIACRAREQGQSKVVLEFQGASGCGHEGVGGWPIEGLHGSAKVVPCLVRHVMRSSCSGIGKLGRL